MSTYKRTIRGKPSRNYYIDYIDEYGRNRTLEDRHSKGMRPRSQKASMGGREHVQERSRGLSRRRGGRTVRLPPAEPGIQPAGKAPGVPHQAPEGPPLIAP